MLFSRDVQTEISRVFLDPNEWPTDDRRPLLYLLRRDLKDQYGKENGSRKRKLKSPLLVCMGIMIGFELLAKLWSGKHQFSQGEASKQTRGFMKSVLGMTNDEAKALVDFRNSLAHSYGLNIGKDRTFSLDDDLGSIQKKFSVTNLGKGKYEFYVNVWYLKKLFVSAIEEYKKLLVGNVNLQKKFMVCLPNLGEIRIERSLKKLS